MSYINEGIALVGNWGYLLIFIIIMLESFPITFFLPGDSLLFTAGFLASLGHFNVSLLIFLAFVGGSFGYFFSFMFGEKLRHVILTRGHSLWFKKKHLDYTQNFFDRYGGKTIIIGRFVPVVRSFSPFLAGAVDMNRKKFWTYTLLGGIAWTASLTLLGYFLGREIPNVDLYIIPIVVAISIISILPTVYEYLKHRHDHIL